MNVVLWILQVALVLLAVPGGAFKAFKIESVASEPFFGALPRAGWAALGFFEMLCGVLLIVPVALNWMPILTPVAATALGLEGMGLCVMYARYSRKLTAANPLSWVLVMTLLAACVACGRYALGPTA